MGELKIYDMGDDCEWWIGDSTPKRMLKAMDKEYGKQDRTFGNPVRALTDAELDSLKFYYDENDHALTRTFREQLALEDHSNPTPRPFASTEF